MNLPNNSITHIHINYGSHVFILQQTKYTIHESNQKVFYKIHKIIWVVFNHGFVRATRRTRRGFGRVKGRARLRMTGGIAPAMNCELRWRVRLAGCWGADGAHRWLRDNEVTNSAQGSKYLEHENNRSQQGRGEQARLRLYMRQERKIRGRINRDWRWETEDLNTIDRWNGWL